MNQLPVTLILIFSAAVIAPILARLVRLPVLVIEIAMGAALGKSWLDIVPSNQLLEFFINFGLIYIMFLAGFEINFGKIRQAISATALISVFSLLVPFIAGMILGSMINVPPLLMGTVLSTTSLGLILPLSKELTYDRRFLNILLGSVILVDMTSIFLLAFYMTFATDSFSITLIYSFVLLLVLFAIPPLLRKVNANVRLERWVSKQPNFSIMIRFAFVLIAIVAAISEKLGFHAIIGSFIAGLIMSELLSSSSPIEKQLESFGYGFFIPIFFILIGSKINLPAIFANFENTKILILIIVVGLSVKIIGTGIAAKLSKFSWRESISMGLFHTARLSLIIAVAEVGHDLGVIDESLFSSFMILAVISAVIGPTLGKVILLYPRSNRGMPR